MSKQKKMNKLKDYNGPLNKRICECGCELEFWPKRKDQVYLDRRHSNFHYNHYKRHKKNKKNEINKMLKKNDELLRLHYSQQNNAEYSVPLEELIHNGFKPQYFIAINNKVEPWLYFSYHFTYSYHHNKEQTKHVKIIKR